MEYHDYATFTLNILTCYPLQPDFPRLESVQCTVRYLADFPAALRCCVTSQGHQSVPVGRRVPEPVSEAAAQLRQGQPVHLGLRASHVGAEMGMRVAPVLCTYKWTEYVMCLDQSLPRSKFSLNIR